MRGQVAAAPQGGANAPQAGGAQQQGFSIMTVVRMVMFWYLITNFFGKKPAPKDPALLTANLFLKGEELDMWVYLAEDPEFSNFNDESSLVWTESNVKYATYGSQGERSLSISYAPSKAVQNNGTLFAHIFFARSGYSPDPKDPTFDRQSTFRLTHPLIAYYPRPKVDRRKNLLGGSLTEEGAAANAAAEAAAKKGEAEEVEELPREFISYWKPNLTINFVEDFTKYPRGQIPEPIRPRILLEAAIYC